MNADTFQQRINTLSKQFKSDTWDVYSFESFKPDLSMNQMIDHTFLKPVSNQNIIDELCKSAIEHRFFSVCINPIWVKHAQQLLSKSHVNVCTVIGFPLGANTIVSKVKETENAIENGADEIDFVLNLSDLTMQNYSAVYEEFSEIASVCKHKNITSKVILETCYLNDDAIVDASILARICGIDFVKTSTGFGSAGATAHHVKLMRMVVGPDLGVKASGGIRTHDQALMMINSGANRIGASSSADLL